MVLSRFFRFESYWSLATGYLLAVALTLVAWLAGAHWFLYFVSGPLIGMVWTFWFLLGAIRLATTLRGKGYTWARWWNCISLQITVPRDAHRAPPRDEVAALPRYTDTPRGLAEFLLQLRSHRISEVPQQSNPPG